MHDARGMAQQTKQRKAFSAAEVLRYILCMVVVKYSEVLLTIFLFQQVRNCFFYSNLIFPSLTTMVFIHINVYLI